MKPGKPSSLVWFALLLALLCPGALTAQQPTVSEGSSSGSSGLLDVESLTDDQILERLYANLERREARLIEREKLLTERETALTEREQNLAKIESDLNEIRTSTLKIEQITQNSVSFWTSYVDDEKTRSREQFWRGFGTGAASGAGLIAGLWLLSTIAK